MYYFIYNGERYTFDPRNPIIEGWNEETGPIIGSQTLQEVLGMSDEEADAAHLEGLKNQFIRPERDRLLAECDWVVTMHKEKGTNIPATWKTYRQALRDITDGLTVPFNKYDYVDMDAIDWPEKPE